MSYIQPPARVPLLYRLMLSLVEKRLGRQAAVAARIDFPNLSLHAVSVHLDAQSTQRHRCEQMRSVLDALPSGLPVILGGDWNTSTYDSSHAFRAILGFWLRVMMGVDHVIRNHYLHPERRFERGLFQLLVDRGFEYQRSNRMGEPTICYDVCDPRATGSWAIEVIYKLFDTEDHRDDRPVVGQVGRVGPRSFVAGESLSERAAHPVIDDTSWRAGSRAS